MPLITQNPNKQAGLVKASPTADIPQPIVTQRISSPDYKGVAVDNRWTSRALLLTHVEGSSWIVDYYSQVLDTDSQLSGQQVSVAAPYQPYQKITKLELKVQSPLATSQNDDSKGMNLEGTAIVYPFMIPNEGDMFVADIGEGMRGVFRITNTLKKSIFKAACYEITYSLDTDQSDKLADLERKVVKNTFFHKDRLNFGKDPLLVKQDHDALLRVGDTLEVLARQYFDRFFSSEYQTILVPDQLASTYDYFLVNFLFEQFTPEDSPQMRFVRKMHMGGDPVMKVNNLWTALSERNPAYLKTAFQKVGQIDTRALSALPLMNSIRYTGIRRAIYPLDAQLVIDKRLRENLCAAPALPLDGPEPPAELYKMVEAVNISQIDETEGWLKTVLVDEYYVLSEQFYKREGQLSTLEDVVWQYLEGKPVDVLSLVATADLWPSWGLLEQFYYVPILMVLLRAVQRGEA